MSVDRASFWRDRRVLVTGCTGLLGSWLTLRLIELGAEVVGLIRDWVPESHLVRAHGLERLRVVRGDVCDLPLMERTFAEYEIDTAFHLAALTIVGVANHSPVPTLETNVRGTWNVLEAARRWPGLTRLVVASSDKAYGTHHELPYSESAPLHGNHPYDASKACADMIAQAFAHSFDMPVAVTRCANLYGGGDLNWNRIVPGSIRSALRGERPIIRSDGTPKRDYLFVPDAVDAYLCLAELMDAGRWSGEAFNFGVDSPKSALEMVEAVLNHLDRRDLQPEVLNVASNEIQDQYLSSEKARRLLGWSPAHTLETGLSKTIEWYRDYLATSGQRLAASR